MGKNKNKVAFGLENVHYAKLTYDSDTKKYAYETPKPISGAVSLSLSAQGSSEPFYADNIEYYITDTNNGYSGNLTVARLTDDFRTDILGETDGLENSEVATSEFALLFEFSGDATKIRHVLYRCKATRPDIASETTTNQKTPKTETLNITSAPRLNDKYVKGWCAQGDTLYDAFFDKVKEPEDIKNSLASGETANEPASESN